MLITKLKKKKKNCVKVNATSMYETFVCQNMNMIKDITVRKKKRKKTEGLREAYLDHFHQEFI